jgi:hypothetical protein
MKYFTNFLKIAFLIIICFNIATLWIIRTERKENLKIKRQLQIRSDSIKQFENHEDIFLLNYSLMYEFQGERIDNAIIFLDEDNNKISLKQLFNHKPRLIFKYSSLNCNVCVDEQITLLKKASEKIGSGNIMIITDYNSPRELSQFVRMNQIDFKVLNLRNMNLTMIDKRFPYYFILDESYSLKLLYIPIKGDTSITQKYFETVSERFFQ